MSKLKVNELDTESGTTITVTAGKTLAVTLADDAIGTAQIATDAVTADAIAANAVDTSEIAANAVTLAEMAGLARGKLIVGDSSGDPSALTVGTADQVLMSDGTDASWSDLSTGTAWQAVKTASFIAVAGNGYPCNTTAASFTVTLPAGSVGDVIELIDYAGTADTNAIILTANGSEKINGTTDDHTISKEREGVRIVYVDATQGWVAATAANDGTKAISRGADTEYLIVGGGGGGGNGTDGAGYGRGGGGAGGYRTNFGGTALTLLGGTVYTSTVGAGGAGSTNGGDSSLSGAGITTITSTGGGAATNTVGNDGGSGGGAGGGTTSTHSGGSGNTPSTSPSQGNDGGDAAGGGGAGGGGASAVGVTAFNTNGGNGGAGTANAITGASVTYAGGGGGGGNTSNGGGGAGGGGTGWRYSGTIAPTNGTDGLGGGGGGAGWAGNSPTGATGGDGVVILRLLTTDYSGTTTGSPTVTTDGSYTVIKFTGTGTYTQ